MSGNTGTDGNVKNTLGKGNCEMKLLLTSVSETGRHKRSNLSSVADSFMRTGQSYSYQDCQITVNVPDRETALYLTKSVIDKFRDWKVCPIEASLMVDEKMTDLIEEIMIEGDTQLAIDALCVRKYPLKRNRI